jgi:uncharacterized protein
MRWALSIRTWRSAPARRLAPKLAGLAQLARGLFAAMVIVTALYVGWRSLA